MSYRAEEDDGMPGAGALDINDPDLWSDDEGDATPALNPYTSTEENPIKQLRKDLDDASPFRGRSRRVKKKRSRVDQRTQPDYAEAKLLGIANQAYVAGKVEEAKSTAQGIIKTSPHVFEAWKLLGQIAHDDEDYDGCYTAWLYAAGLRERDGVLWEEVAKVALELGRIDDADYAYIRALRSRPRDAALAYSRLEIHLGQDGKQRQLIECYKTLLKIHPYEMSSVKELAKLYLDTDKPVQAVELYEDASKHWMSSIEADARQIFSWNEVNILAELYDTAAAGDKRPAYWRALLTQIKATARWLEGREAETYWDDRNDDAEWDTDDTRRNAAQRYHAASTALHDLPIELRCWLAKARLYLGDVKEGLRHLEVVNAEQLDYPELMIDAGRMLSELRLHTEALSFYTPLLESEDFSGPDLWRDMAHCAVAASQLDQARECLEALINNDDRDVDSLILLAEVYEKLNERELAMDTIERVREVRREMTDAAGSDDEDAMSVPATVTPRRNVSGKRNRKSAPKRAAMKDESLASFEILKTEQTTKSFELLQTLQAGMLAEQGEDFDKWLEVAFNLVEEFRNVPVFWPRDRATVFRGVVVQPRNIADRLANLTQRLEDDEEAVANVNMQRASLEESTFRGQHILSWMQLFVQTAVCLCVLGRTAEAFDILDAAMEANVFRQHPDRYSRLVVAKLLLALKTGHGKLAIEVFRLQAFKNELHGDWLRLGMAAFSISDREALRDDATQKAFLRAIKTLDMVMDPSRQIPETQVLREFKVAMVESPPSPRAAAVFFNFYGNLLASSRSHLPALHYYVRAWASDAACARRDPMQMLQIGLAYLQRSLQRQSDNRHWQIAQAMSFFQAYHRLRSQDKDAGVRQEGDYNLAKVYHHLGLAHLAVPLYHRVLDASDSGQVDPEHDLARSAAFNLHLIHVLGGDPARARQILYRYITI